MTTDGSHGVTDGSHGVTDSSHGVTDGSHGVTDSSQPRVTKTARSFVVTALSLQIGGLSLLGLVLGLGGTIAIHSFFPLEQLRQSIDEAARATPLVPPIVQVVPHYLPAFFTVLFVVSLLLCAVSVGAFRRRPWARPALIAVLFLAIAMNIFVCTTIGYLLLSPQAGAGPNPISAIETLRYGLVAVIALLTMGFSLFFGLIVGQLRTSAMVKEFTPQ